MSLTQSDSSRTIANAGFLLLGVGQSCASTWVSSVLASTLPLRSYAKWLRLTHAVQLLASGLSMTDAAHAVGFSDSAHFSRTFRALLGIDPSSALAEVRLQEG